MKKYLRFIWFGTFFSTVEEFLTVVVLKQDFASYIFTLIILFPVYLTFVYFSSNLLNRVMHALHIQELVHYFLYGLIGLLIEWFVIGLAPWKDAQANPVVLILFNLGMFSFWATVAFAPRLFIQGGELSNHARRSVIKFYIPYFIVVYLAAIIIPHQLKFIAIIALIVAGYMVLNLFYFRYFMDQFRLLRKNRNSESSVGADKMGLS